MLTARTALPLLAGLATPRGPAALLDVLGFGRPLPLDRETSAALGLPDDCERAWSAHRPGILRALVLHLAPGRPLREQLAVTSQRVAARAPEFAWLLVAVRPRGDEAAVATWLDEGTRIRRAALMIDPARLHESDGETLAALAAAARGDDPLVHLRWHEILGREALSTRFYRALERAVLSLAEGAEGAAPGEARRTLALTAASRLLFLSFLQSRGWLDGDPDFLVRHVDAAHGHGIHRRVLDPLFFGTLNTRAARRAPAARAFGEVPFLNGGLFARSPLEARYRGLRFRDEELGALFADVLTRYRFTSHEERGETSEAAIDPEMLGRAFESLMASRDRRDSGAFYTPQPLVERTVQAALAEFLSAGGIDLEGTAIEGPGTLPPHAAAAVRACLGTVRVLDPACGTGAFLVYLLERITDLHVRAGSPGPRSAIKRQVLTASVFGVDVNPMAVWLCELRLWLATVIDLEVERPRDVPPLPNLDRNVRVGDALDGGGWVQLNGEAGGPGVARLRGRYARATGRRKATLARALDAAERRAALAVVERRLAAVTEERWSLLAASRGRDLFGGRRGSLGAERERRTRLQGVARSLRAQRHSLRGGGALPFRFASHFADALHAGGFDLVVGNPPWVRLHRIPPDRREALRAQFRTFRDAAWHRGSTPPGFAAQVDLAALFAEQAASLARRGGVLALLLPMKLWRSLAGGGTRRLLHGEQALRVLEDWSEAPAAFDAAVYPSLVVARRAAPASTDGRVHLTVHRRRLAIGWQGHARDLSFDDTPGAPWILLPPDAIRAFRRLADAGVPLDQSPLGMPVSGVKCGCNEAFLVQATASGAAAGDTVVGTTRGNVHVEAAMLRPVLRGEHVRRWRADLTRECVVWTHGRDGRPLRALPPGALRWLTRWRGTLAGRSDVRGSVPWWALFRIEGARDDCPRVVWADVSRGPRALVLPAGSPVVPLNSCYVLPCRDDTDAAALVALLNSPLAAAWLEAIAEPARGGYRRYLAWTVACLPVPRQWARARLALAALGARAVGGEAVGEGELLAAACEAYGLGVRSVAPLIEWTRR